MSAATSSCRFVCACERGEKSSLCAHPGVDPPERRGRQPRQRERQTGTQAPRSSPPSLICTSPSPRSTHPLQTHPAHAPPIHVFTPSPKPQTLIHSTKTKTRTRSPPQATAQSSLPTLSNRATKTSELGELALGSCRPPMLRFALRKSPGWIDRDVGVRWCV